MYVYVNTIYTGQNWHNAGATVHDPFMAVGTTGATGKDPDTRPGRDTLKTKAGKAAGTANSAASIGQKKNRHPEITYRHSCGQGVISFHSSLLSLKQGLPT
jgi:hypothetical protein